MKRIFLFIATNIAIMLVLAVVVSLLGADRFLTQNGLDLQKLLIFCAVFGMGGSFISLAISKPMAKFSTKAKVIETPSTKEEKWLLDIVGRQAQMASIGMPEVAIFPSNEVNAFATGMSKNNALVAVSAGLLNQMTPAEAEAVLAHEITHVSNGDMITLTLIQGVVNTFVMFFARIIGYGVDSFLSRGQNNGIGIGYYITTFVMQIVLGILASTIVMWFSRQREFRADEGGAQLAGTKNMVAALQRLQSLSGQETRQQEGLPDSIAAFGISGKGGLSRLFMTHPPLEERIQRLQSRTHI